MLYRIIEAHGGTLPDDVLTVFCNTGKEHDATLDFVQECGERWNTPIRWIEYVDHETFNQRVREVTYETASRDGEPFAAVIGRKNYLPNPVTRFCTIEMKIHATHRFLRNLGWENGYLKAIGFRADEPRRASRARGRTKDPWELCFPLYEAGETLADVNAFWSVQPFRLMLPQAQDSTTPLGNCDLCFLKSAGKLASIIRDDPARAVWWAAQERRIVSKNNMGRFRADRPSYQAMLDQGSIALDGDDDLVDCACTD